MSHAAPEDATHVQRFRFDRIRWKHLLAISGLHVMCLWAPATFSWSALAVALVLYWITLSCGVSAGYHRLLTHRSYETPKFFRYFLTAVATLAWQGGPIFWVGTHRMHHRDSDTEMDPHSPHHGFSWAHLLWCLVDDPYDRDYSQACKDLAKDPVMRWIEKYFYVPQLALAGILYLLGGWSWVVWGIAVRTVASYHATWFVNSASHLWGYRNFDTREESRNNWWVALISWGEGWHNNHHAHQRSASFGLRWFEVDLTYWTIRLFSLVGLARNVTVATLDSGAKTS